MAILFSKWENSTSQFLFPSVAQKFFEVWSYPVLTQIGNNRNSYSLLMKVKINKTTLENILVLHNKG